MAAPENMEAETLQAPKSAPHAQKDGIGQRGVEAAPEMEEERVLEPTTDTTGEQPHVEGRRRTSVTTIPHSPGRGWRTGWRHLKNSNQ